MTYKKGQWLKCENEIDGFTKGQNYKITGRFRNADFGIQNDGGGITYYDKNDITKYFSPAPKTFYTLEVGDVVVDEYEDERPVLEVLDNVFLVSFSDDKGAGGFFYTPQSAIDKGWTIKVAEEEVEELTMQEVCKELGRTIKIKK